MEPERAVVRRTFSQEDFDVFARLSGDDNPIHTDPDFSAGSRFGRPVAHGMFLFSVLSGVIGELAGPVVIDEIELMFPAPTFAGEEMEVEVTIDSTGTAVAAEMRNPSGEPTCTARATIRATS